MKREEIEKLTAQETAALVAELFPDSDILEKAYSFEITKNQFTKDYECRIVFSRREYLEAGYSVANSLELAILRATLSALVE